MAVVKNCADLAHYFAGGKIALHPKKSSQAELAVNGAADLAGDADSGAVPRSRNLLTARFTSIARFPAVPFGHPHGFDRLTVLETDQVANGSVVRNEFLVDLWQTQREILCQLATKLLREGGNLAD